MLRRIASGCCRSRSRALWLGVVDQLQSSMSFKLPAACGGGADVLRDSLSPANYQHAASQCRGFAAIPADEDDKLGLYENARAAGGLFAPLTDELDVPAGTDGSIADSAAAAAQQQRELQPLAERRLLHAGIVGAPNAGKSSLVNALAGRKVAAVSHRTNTTAAARLATFTDGGAVQVALYDTPGVTSAHRSRDHGARVQGAWQVAQHCGAVLFLVDAPRQLEQSDPRVVRLASQLAERWHAARDSDGGDSSGGGGRGFVAALVLNKIDLVVDRHRLPWLAKSLAEAAGGVFDQVFATSALKGQGVAELREFLAEKATPSGWLPDPTEDIDGGLSAAADLAVELVREQLFRRLSGELPYVLRPVPTEAKRLRDGALLLKQTIFVRSESVRAILVGTKGEVIGEVGIRARQALQRALDCPVHLYLSVLVRKGGNDVDDTSQLMAQRGA